MVLSDVEEILAKYNNEEHKIDALLQLKLDEFVEQQESAPTSQARISLSEVSARNRLLLKDLEVTKANLRSKAIFSPAEMQWERIYHNYNECPAMLVTTYKCHVPMYV